MPRSCVRSILACLPFVISGCSAADDGASTSTSSATVAPTVSSTAPSSVPSTGDAFCDVAAAGFDEFNRVITTVEGYRRLQDWHRDVARVAPPAVSEDLELVAAGMDDFIDLQSSFDAGELTFDEFMDAGEVLLEADDGMREATSRTAALLVERCGLGPES